MLRLPAVLLEQITQACKTLSHCTLHKEFRCPSPLLEGDPSSISLQTVSCYKGLHAALSKCYLLGLLCVHDSCVCIFFLDQPADPANSLQDFKMIPNKHIKRCSYLYSLGKCKLKARWDTTTYPLNKKGWHSQVVVKIWNKMMQLLWKRVCQFLTKLSTYHVIHNSTTQYYLFKGNKSICPHKDIYECS